MKLVCELRTGQSIQGGSIRWDSRLWWWPPSPWSLEAFAVPVGRSLSRGDHLFFFLLAGAGSPGWALTSLLHSPHATGQVMSIAAAERPKPSVIRAIKTSEVVGKGCLPPGGTSSRSSTQEGMAQETNWNYTFFLSWVFWLEVSPEERARPSPLSARVD